MKKSKKKKQIDIKFHQHQDEFGNVFGAPHPIDAMHKNKNTQKYHDLTIKETLWR